MAGQTEGEKQAERWGGMTQRMNDMAGDIADLKTGQERQSTEQVKQGNEITKLKTQIALAGAFGGAVGSLIVGLVLLLAQKGSP